jgi:predicted nucleic acid-binding protein
VSVYLDTSALFAVLDADDQKHLAARREWERELNSDELLHTSSYVLVETAALLQRRIGLDGLRTFTADILPVINIIWVDEGIHRSAWHALLVSSRRDISLVDCVSFEAIRRLGIDQVFCFDAHFAEQGFHVLPAGS